MSEFICGVVFFMTGAALLIHNKTLVERSLEFQQHSPAERDGLIIFNRILCVLAGLMTSFAGCLTMLSGR